MILENWIFWVILYLLSAVIFAHSFKHSNSNMKNASLLTILLEVFTALFACLFIPLFELTISTNANTYLILLVVVIIYTFVDRLNIEARYGLEPSTFSMLKQLSSVFIIIFGIIFLKEKIIIQKIIGAILILLANVSLTYNKGKFQLNKYFYMSFFANLLFAVAMLININISEQFNIGIYTIITVLTPAILIFLFGRYKIKDLKEEFDRYDKKTFLLASCTWAIMLISSVKAYQYGNVVIVASLLSLTAILNSIIEFIKHRSIKQLLKKIIISIIMIIGIVLIKI